MRLCRTAPQSMSTSCDSSFLPFGDPSPRNWIVKLIVQLWIIWYTDRWGLLFILIGARRATTRKLLQLITIFEPPPPELCLFRALIKLENELQQVGIVRERIYWLHYLPFFHSSVAVSCSSTIIYEPGLLCTHFFYHVDWNSDGLYDLHICHLWNSIRRPRII